MAAHFVHHLVTALGVPLLPFIRDEFSLDYTQAGFLISAFTVSYGVGQLGCGWLADSLSRRKLLFVGLAGPALAGLAIGFSQSYWMLAALMVFMGLSGGGYHPAASPLISAVVSAKHLGKALGFHVVGGAASYFMAPLAGVAIAAAFGWRGSFIGLAAPTLIFAVFFNYHLRGQERVRSEAAKSSGEAAAEPPAPKGWFSRLLVVLIMASVTQAAFQSTVPFVPLYLVDYWKVNEEIAAALISLVYFAGLWAAPLGGYLADRLGKLRVLWTVCLVSGPALYLLNVVPYGFGFGALLILMGMLMIMRGVMAETFLVAETPQRHRSTVLGIYFFSAMEGGGVLTPLIGYLIDLYGFPRAFTITSVSLTGFFLLCALAYRITRGMRRGPQAPAGA